MLNTLVTQLCDYEKDNKGGRNSRQASLKRKRFVFSLEKLTRGFMKAKSFDLAWVVVNDLKAAKKFYTEVLGFKVLSSHEEHGWIELMGQEGGSILGLASKSPHNPILPGQNGVITISCEDIVKARKDLEDNGTTLVGDIIEVIGAVKLQTFKDADGNFFQLAQTSE